MRQFDIKAFLLPYPELAQAIETSHIRESDPDETFKAGLMLIINGAKAS